MGCPPGRLYRECQRGEGCPFSCAQVSGRDGCYSDGCEEGCHCPPHTYQHHGSCLPVGSQQPKTLKTVIHLNNVPIHTTAQQEMFLKTDVLQFVCFRSVRVWWIKSFWPLCGVCLPHLSHPCSPITSQRGWSSSLEIQLCMAAASGDNDNINNGSRINERKQTNYTHTHTHIEQNRIENTLFILRGRNLNCHVAHLKYLQ